MNYLIDDVIFFNSLDFTLSSANPETPASDGKVHLSIFGGRMLMLLLKCKSEVVTRDELSQFAWGEYGLETTQSNLNQHILMLRKALAPFSASLIIKTVPKVGFTIPNDISVIVAEDTGASDSASGDAVLAPSLTLNENAFALERTTITNGLSILLVALTLLVCFQYISKSQIPAKAPLFKLDFQQCDVQTFNTDMSNNPTIFNQKMISKMLAFNNINCKKDDIVFLDFDYDSRNNSIFQMSTTLCSLFKESTYNCNSVINTNINVSELK